MKSSLGRIFLVLLTILHVHSGVWGQVVCYTCAWYVMKNDGEICRPQNFRLPMDTEFCPYGCAIDIIYEFDPVQYPAPSNTLTSLPRSNGTRTRIQKEYRMPPKPPMSLYHRGCAKVRQARAGCKEITIQNFYREHCYCNRNFCNGESSGSDWSVGSLGHSVLLMVGCLLITSYRSFIWDKMVVEPTQTHAWECNQYHP